MWELLQAVWWTAEGKDNFLEEVEARIKMWIQCCLYSDPRAGLSLGSLHPWYGSQNGWYLSGLLWEARPSSPVKLGFTCAPSCHPHWLVTVNVFSDWLVLQLTKLNALNSISSVQTWYWNYSLLGPIWKCQDLKGFPSSLLRSSTPYLFSHPSLELSYPTSLTNSFRKRFPDLGPPYIPWIYILKKKSWTWPISPVQFTISDGISIPGNSMFPWRVINNHGEKPLP